MLLASRGVVGNDVVRDVPAGCDADGSRVLEGIALVRERYLGWQMSRPEARGRSPFLDDSSVRLRDPPDLWVHEFRPDGARSVERKSNQSVNSCRMTICHHLDEAHFVS